MNFEFNPPLLKFSLHIDTEKLDPEYSFPMETQVKIHLLRTSPEYVRKGALDHVELAFRTLFAVAHVESQDGFILAVSEAPPVVSCFFYMH